MIIVIAFFLFLVLINAEYTDERYQFLKFFKADNYFPVVTLDQMKPLLSLLLLNRNLILILLDLQLLWQLWQAQLWLRQYVQRY